MRRLAVLLSALLASACSPQEVIHTIFAEHGEDAEHVAWCESRLDPTAVSPDGSNHGLFQINTVHRSTFERVLPGWTWADRYDLVVNTAFAKWLFDRQGWAPWTCAP